MNEYAAIYESRFVRNLARYSSLRQRIQRRVEQVLREPYTGTERLGQVTGGLDLRGCRSARIDRNFRVIFVICEECRRIEGVYYTQKKPLNTAALEWRQANKKPRI